MKKKATTSKRKSTNGNSFPPGWNARRVKDVIAYYDRQTEDEGLAEYEAAMKVDGHSMLVVPTKLIPEIRRLIKQRQGI